MKIWFLVFRTKIWCLSGGPNTGNTNRPNTGQSVSALSRETKSCPNLMDHFFLHSRCTSGIPTRSVGSETSGKIWIIAGQNGREKLRNQGPQNRSIGEPKCALCAGHSLVCGCIHQRDGQGPPVRARGGHRVSTHQLGGEGAAVRHTR